MELMAVTGFVVHTNRLPNPGQMVHFSQSGDARLAETMQQLTAEVPHLFNEFKLHEILMQLPVLLEQARLPRSPCPLDPPAMQVAQELSSLVSDFQQFENDRQTKQMEEQRLLRETMIAKIIKDIAMFPSTLVGGICTVDMESINFENQISETYGKWTDEYNTNMLNYIQQRMLKDHAFFKTANDLYVQNLEVLRSSFQCVAERPDQEMTNLPDLYLQQQQQTSW
jgi:hypothetical protein